MARSQRHAWFERFIETAVSRPWRVLLFFGVLTLGGMALASRLEFRGSFVELLPQGSREVRDLTRVSEKAGGDGYLVLVATGDTRARLESYAGELQARLEALPEVRYVEHRYDVGFFRQNALLLLPVEKLAALRQDVTARLRYERQLANPFYIDLGAGPQAAPPDFEAIAKKYAPDSPVRETLGSADGTEVYLMIKPAGTAGDLDFARGFVDMAVETGRKLAAERYPAVKLQATGNFQGRIEEDAVMRDDLSRAGALSALIAVGLILLATRRISALAVVGIPVVVGVVLTFAFAELAIGHLNVVTGFLVAILIGLGIEYGVHLSMRYWEERRTRPARQAIATAVRGTFSGAMTSAVTNAAAFFVLLLAQFQAFKQFGLLAGLGVLLAVLAAYALGPSLLAIAERLRPARAGAAAAAAPRPKPERQWRRWPTSAIVAIALSVVGFAVFSVAVSSRLRFETDMRKLQGESPASRLNDHVTAQIGQPLSPAIFLVDDVAQAARVEAIIAEVKQRHGAQSAILDAASLNDLLPREMARREVELAGLREVLQGLDELPAEMTGDPRLQEFRRMVDAKPYGLDAVPVEVRRRFEAADGEGTFLLMFPSVENTDTEDLRRWASQIDEVMAGAEAQGISVAVLDSNRIAARIFALVRADGPLILWSAALVVFLVILVSLRSLERALLVTGPLYLGMTCLAGGMYLFDVQLNFINAVVLPNLLAIAVDNSVHLFHRYEEEGPGSLGKVVRHTGLAAVVATLSNAAGYGALLVANHQGLRSIGQIALLGVMCTFLGTTVFFPALLALLERWKGRGGRVAGKGAVDQSLKRGDSGAEVAPPVERMSA